ncbi:MAG: TonB-dependent hemoglobin/transferrin/lactoferrin family receptor [Pseudomonadota bacterium]
MKGKITVLSGVLLASAGITAAADEGPLRLQETIIGSQSSERSVGELRNEHFQRQLTDNIEDTVRYIPGVQVNDTGNRFNDDGFNMRGLEGDFINVSVDGVSQGETLNPPSFQPYGMFGSSRGAVEIETVKAVRLTKGPNSVTDGNGALAGSVVYVTKDPRDFLDDGDDVHFGAKAGYDARSDENLFSGTIAGRAGAFEGLLIVTQRDGHETEAHDDGDDILGPDRGQADPIDRDETAILVKLNWNITDNQVLGLVYEDNNREASVLPLGREPAPGTGLGTYYDFTGDDTNDRDRIGLYYEIVDSEAGWFDSMEASADYQWLYTQGITTFNFNSSFSGDGTTTADDIRRREDRSFGQESYSFAIDFSKSFDGDAAHELTYGLEYEQFSVQNRLFDIRWPDTNPASSISQFTVDPTWVPETDITRFSVYIKDEFNLSESVNVFAGVRYDTTEYEPEVDAQFQDPTGNTVNDADYSAFVGEVGLGWEFIEGHTLAFAIGQGYKAPTTQNLYLGASSELVTDLITGQQFANLEEVSNPNLEPERSTNYEVAYEYSNERAFVRVAAFYSQYDELIQDISQTIDYGQTISYLEFTRRGPVTVSTATDEFVRASNVGEIDLVGFEIEGQFAVTDNMNMIFGFSHVDGEHQNDGPTINGFEDGDELATAAPDSATLGISYDAPNERWGMSAFAVWTDERPEVSDRSISSLNNGEGPVYYPDAWTTVDVFGYYQINDNLRVSAAVRNLFDERYVRWEVINNVRPGSGGFFAGASPELGWQRYTEPGRSFAINLTAEF